MHNQIIFNTSKVTDSLETNKNINEFTKENIVCFIIFITIGLSLVICYFKNTLCEFAKNINLIFSQEDNTQCQNFENEYYKASFEQKHFAFDSRIVGLDEYI